MKKTTRTQKTTRRDSKGRFCKTCENCGGSGELIKQNFGFNGMYETFKTCPECRGSGNHRD